MCHELRKRGTSAADLKFLHRLRQTLFRNFKSKSGTRIICLLVPLLLPKRSEEHTSELQSQSNLVCRLLLEKKKKNILISPSHDYLQTYIQQSFYIPKNNQLIRNRPYR